MATAIETTQTAAAEAMSERLFVEAVGGAHLMTTYIGVQLGFFEALAQLGGLTAEALATATGTDAWYTREWLQAETIAGLVTADAEDLASAQFTLAGGVADTLVDEVNPAYLGGLTHMLAAFGAALPSLLDALRSGAGVPASAYGPAAATAQAALNRPAFVHSLAAEWLPAVPGVVDRLSDATNPAAVADIGCGAGWAAIELAKAFPSVRVDGFDSDEASIAIARRNAAEHGVAGRVTFEVVDATAGYGDHRYDLVLFLECLHDISRPAEALAAARQAVTEGGTVLVMDERVGAVRPPAGDLIETFMAACSVLWCLPQSRVDPECDAPGTVMRPPELGRIATRAGWAGVETLPIEHPFWRFYLLRN